LEEKDRTQRAVKVVPDQQAKTEMSEIQRLVAIMAKLRDRSNGCPWDVQQTFETIAPYTIEEAYEVADAIERGDMEDLKDELGDLLLQVVFHSRIAEEAGVFAFPDVAAAINAKLIRRHPHVFGGKGTSADNVKVQWETLKAEEREAKAVSKGGGGSQAPLFDDIPAGLPALLRSAKIQRRAARIGFDWPSIEPIFDKVDEELLELKSEVAAASIGSKIERQFEEFGDLMFVLVNLGLRLGIDTEAALRAANSKFVRRMEAMHASAQDAGLRLDSMSLDEMQALWDRAKASEIDSGDT
jgi:nucleoside triphosphate diphosphatase